MSPEMTDAELDEAMAVEVMGWSAHIAGHGSQAFYYDKSRFKFIDISDFHPTADLNQAWECLTKSRYKIRLNNSMGYVEVILDWNTGDCKATAKHENPASAICEALLMAVRGER